MPRKCGTPRGYPNSECGILSTAECGCFHRTFGSALDPRSCALQVPGDPEAGQACALSLTWRTAPCRRGCHLSGRKAGAAEDRGSIARMPEAAPTPDHRHAAWARGAELNPRISPPRPPRPQRVANSHQVRGAAGSKSSGADLQVFRVSALNTGSSFACFACFAVELHCSGLTGTGKGFRGQASLAYAGPRERPTAGVNRGDRRPSAGVRSLEAPAPPCRSGRSACGSACETGIPSADGWGWADRLPG